MRPTAPSLPLRLACCLLAYLLALSTYTAAPPSKTVAAAGATTRSAAALGRARADAPRREGELIVRFREEVSEQDRDAIAAVRGLRRGSQLRGGGRLEKLKLGAGQDAVATAELLRFLPEVELAEPNYLIKHAQVMPDDARFGEQWALSNVGQAGGSFGSDIGAPAAWGTSTGAASTVVAVLDSGVDFAHPDLSDNQWINQGEKANSKDDDRNGYVDDLAGWDWVAGGGDVRDEQGHGTAVAGLIAASGNNGVGTAGVMWRAGVMSLRVLDNTGTGDVASAVEAINYAAAMGAQVINCSWGTDAESAALREAVTRAGSRGVLVVASAGNGARDVDAAPHYPASFDLPNVIAVASTNQFDNLAPFSNWGAAGVDVAAPGTDLLTTAAGGGYRAVSGTSASAPLVAGVAGLIRTAYPSLSAEANGAAVVGGVRRVQWLEGRVSAGGVVSAAGALASAAGGAHGSGQQGGQGDNPGNAGPSQRPPTPRPGTAGHGGRTPDEFRHQPEAPLAGAPPAAPNLDELRRQPSYRPETPAPITADLMPVCDIGCGGAEPPTTSGSSDPDFSAPRTRPENETGRPGEDLGSRNFNWGLPLVSLPGRAGLDLGVALYYNSLVWTKHGSTVRFNADRGFPGPGFTLGFPKLQQRYYNSAEGAYAYVMITPAGGRVELKQTAAANVYEAEDSSYTQLVDNGNGTALVRTSDGTRYWFAASVNGELRGTEIKDRNGNYITITYNSLGRPTRVTDTLGRQVNFNYDANNYLTSISQAWGSQTHNWATFSYGLLTIQHNFPGLSVQGPAGGEQIPVLTQVGLHDGSSYRFKYTPFGQVWQIARHAPDSSLLSSVGYNLPGSDWLASSAQSDCPRFTERRDWIRRGVRDADAEVVTRYSASADGSWSQVTLPDDTPANANDNVVQKEYFATSGWQKGLTTRTETFLAGTPAALKKWTTTTWTQDNESLAYQKNPRVRELNVQDAEGNHRRAVVGYATNSGVSLPASVEEYGKVNGALALLRRTTSDYKWDAVYVDRRVLGLVWRRQVFDGAGALLAKTEYWYDWAGELFVDTPTAAVQHDRTNYGLSFVGGRGNLQNILRYDVSDPENLQNTRVETKFRYNTSGSMVAERDHQWHETSYDYADSFSDGAARNTYAYPTKATDADGHFSTAQYGFATGVVTRTQDPKGAVATMQYDEAGRILRASTLLNGSEYSHRRWIYSGSMLFVVTAQTALSNTSEFYSEEHYDGWGRVRAASVQHPGSDGGNRATYVRYDPLGRAVSTAGPIEITSGWEPAGDDETSGWQWTAQEYDWQGRPTKRIRPDGRTSELSYGGCGCAGGEVVTARDERGRRRKLYKDSLGRLAKVEELNWDQTVYSTAAYSYNGRDQLTRILHHRGTEAGPNQGRTFAYDGHGRLKSRTTLEQGTTTYSYNPDDTLNTVTDARGATAAYAYNYRHLVTSITYSAPAGVAATPNASFEYDGAGNRTRMDDGAGYVTYAYDALSRLTSETRRFSALAASYTLSYGYNAAGQLTSITNPWNVKVGYAYDVAGRVTGVTGSGYAGVSSYASGIEYSAHGGVKAMTYGNGRTLSAAYDALGRLTKWDVAGVQGYAYKYDHFNEQTGRVTFADSLYDNRLDRSYDYDHVGRLTHAYTGQDARGHAGLSAAWGQDGPYASPQTFDVWGNMTGRQGWGGEGAWFTATYSGNRRAGFTYDAAGNVTGDGSQTYTYDATGQQATAASAGYSLQQQYDGDRLRVRKVEGGAARYYLRSSALGGQIVAEVTASGVWGRGLVYGGGGELLALQANSSVHYSHEDPYTKSRRVTDSAGAVTSGVEVDPWGGLASGGWTFNAAQQPRKFATYERDAGGGDEAMHRRYDRLHARFLQPDPYDGSYNLADPQSFNRYSYTQNDPVNFTDPSGLTMSAQGCGAEYSLGQCGGAGGFWGGGAFGGHVAEDNRLFGGMPGRLVGVMLEHEERANNDRHGHGYQTNAEVNRELADFFIFYELYEDGSLWTDFNIFTDAGGSSRAQELAREMNRRPIGQTFGVLYGTSVAVGAGIGTGLYATGAVGYHALADRLAVSLISRADISRQLIGPQQTKLLGQLFKGTDTGLAGARQALSNMRVPAGLRTEALIAYRELTRRTMVLGIDKLGVQAVRKQIIDRVLLRRGLIF